MELDRHRLEEERRWRLANYQTQVERLVRVVVDSIQRDAKELLSRDIAYTDDRRDGMNFVDQAGELQHALLSAVNNADFRGLTKDAGELHAVCVAIHALDKMKAELPATVQMDLEAAEDGALRARIEEKKARVEEIDARLRDGCFAGVHVEGRGVGFHRCQHKGAHTVHVDMRPGRLGNRVEERNVYAGEIKLCGVHKRKFDEKGHIHVYTPSEWEQRQDLDFRSRTAREIAAMEAQLPPALEAGQQPEIEA
jgi:hypothetical protein